MLISWGSGLVECVCENVALQKCMCTCVVAVVMVMNLCRIIYQFFSNPSLESKSNLTGIQLLGIIVANGMAPFDPTTSGNIDEKK